MSNDERDHDVVDFLALVAGLSAREQRHPTWRYQSIPELLLDLAGPPRAVNAALPDGFTPGERQECFYNAHTLAMSHLELVYVEGVAQATILPVPHAWCVNPSTGVIVDPTWANLASTTTRIYLGLAFTTGFIAAHGLETGSPSILETDYLRKHRALRHGFVLNPAGQVTGWGNP